MDTIYIKPGLKIHKFEDESADIITVVTITLLSPAEFNRLAMEAPLFKRVVAKLAQLDNFYPNDEELERLLEDIAELEKPG